jgi:glycerol-1-phosphate dehydrogenase [NAD(P)+]
MAIDENTRPASGSETLFSHYLVERAAESGERLPSHGITVGFGTLISSLLYRYVLEEKRPESWKAIEPELLAVLPDPSDVKALLERSGIGASAKRHVGTRDELRRMIWACSAPEKKYTILRWLKDNDCLAEAADYASERIPE